MSIVQSIKRFDNNLITVIKRNYYKPYQLTLLQKSILTTYFAIGSIIDPNRGELVAGLGDLTSQPRLQSIYNKIIKDEDGKLLLKDKPIISSTSLNIKSLDQLNKNTLGYQYAHYMNSNHFNPDERSTVRFISHENPIIEGDLSYIMYRYRQVHDFWHVLSGLPPSILGEIGLKWFELKVTGLPVCLLSGLVGPVRLSLEEQKILVTKLLPWVYKSNCNIIDLLSFRYEDNLDVPVDIIRKRLNFHPAPKIQ